MEPSKKHLFIFIGIAVALIFGFIILKYFKDKKKTPLGGDKINDIIPTNTNTSPAAKMLDSLPNGSFPIEKGQTSKLVYMLQYSLNKNKGSKLVTDGIFGSLTLAALKSGYNVEKVNQALGVEIYLAMTKKPNVDNYILAAFQNLNLNA